MALVTWLPRVLPLVVFSRMPLPAWALRFLNHVPVAVMAALLAQELLIADETLVPLSSNMKLIAAVPTFIVGILTRSLMGTVLTGIISLMLLRYLM